MTALRRIERLLPLFAALVAAILLFSGLETLGLWDPWELDAADSAKHLADADRVPMLAGVAIRAGLTLFGNHEWAGRLFGALGMFATVLTSMALARRISDARSAAYAAIVAATTPFVVLHSQLMLGDGMAIGLQSLLGLALVGLIFPFTTNEKRILPERLAWLVLAIASATLATLTRGVLLGIAAPLVATLGIVLTAPPKDRDARIAAAIVALGAIVTMALTAKAVYADAGTYSPWIGAIPIGSSPPTFDAGIENVFHSLAPWSPLLIIAVVRSVMDESEHAASKRMYVLWAAFAWVAYVIFSSRYGVPTYLAIAPLAALGGACLREIELDDTADRVSAVVVLLFLGLLIRDFALYPSSPLSALPVTPLAVPGGFDPRKQWAVAMLLVGLPTALMLAIPNAPTPAAFGALPSALREAWRKGGIARLWLVLLGILLVALFVFGVVAGALGARLHMSSLLVRKGFLIAAIPFLLVGAAVGGIAGLSAWSRLGRFRIAPTLIGGVLFGCWVAFGFSRQVSEHFSPRELYETYTELRQPGDVLLDYHTGGRASKYYAPQPILVLTEQQMLIRKLAEDGRRWALFPRPDLPTVDREFRRLRNRHLFVADATSQRFVLVTNSPIGNRRDGSPLTQSVLNEAPTFQHRVGTRFGNAIELLGYDIELPGGDYVGPGQPFYVTWYWKSLARPPGAYTVFLHVDGAGKRLGGDHIPVDGLVPVTSWDPGDVIVDRQELSIPTDFRAGTYTMFIGFFAGDNRLPITSGPKDDENRAIAGTIQVR